MMEIEAASTPRGTTPTSNCFSSSSQHRQPLFHPQPQLPISSSTVLPRSLKSSLQENGVVITPHLAPHSEYEVSSSAGNNYISSQHLSATRHPLTKSTSNPTPSPDSAIHSVYYSPSQSPVDPQSINHTQSRQLSGLSSPFSMRTTPSLSLSRTNSDASQYGSSSLTSLPSSVSATTSPISSSHQYSPTDSPIQTRHHSGGGVGGQTSISSQNLNMPPTGHAQQQYPPPPTLPSAPLPQSIANRVAQLSLPPALHASMPLALQQQEDLNRKQAATTMSEYMEGTNQEFERDKTSGVSTQPGISRQQLINR